MKRFSFFRAGENIIPGCAEPVYQLTPTSGPIIVINPGYPAMYHNTEECGCSIQISPQISETQVRVTDRSLPQLGTYVCGGTLHREIRLHESSSNSSCPELTLVGVYPGVNLVTFVFHKFSGDDRGVLFEITAGTYLQGHSTALASIDSLITKR